MSEGDGESQDGEGGQEGNGSGKGQKQSQKGSGKGDKNQDKDGKEKGDKGGCGKNGDEPSYGKYGKNDAEMSHLDKIFENIEQSKGQTLDQHLGDEVPDELRKEIVKDIMENLKARGLENGDMETILNKLRKSKKDYLKDIKRAIATDIFGSSKNRTIVRPHRHGIDGLKGSKKYKNKINCILDTSGSMGGDFEKVLSYVFQNDVEINMIQIDTQVQGFQVIKNKRELERMNIKGLGGTVLQPAIDFISETRNKISLYNTIILTDGYTDTLNFSHIKGKTLILSTAQQCGIDYDNGRVKQIIIDKDK